MVNRSFECWPFIPYSVYLVLTVLTTFHPYTISFCRGGEYGVTEEAEERDRERKKVYTKNKLASAKAQVVLWLSRGTCH